MNAETPLRIDLLARSSSGDEPYRVSIEFRDSRVRATCDCQAGRHGLHCKHRLAVAQGDNAVLYDAAQYPDLARASDLLSRSAIRPVVDTIVTAQKKVDKINRELKVQKALLVRLMAEGAAVDDL